MICKILRKAGLGLPALKLIKLLPTGKESLPEYGEALALLQNHSADPATSCIREKSARTQPGDIELDIIIPAYNVEKYIGRCLDSALNQETEHSFRLIVIDDGSKDATGSIIDSYAADSRILIKHQENRGFSGARNAGLELSDAKFITFLDSDDTLPAGAVDALLEAADKSQAAIVEGGFCSVDTEGKLLSSTGHKSGILDVRTGLTGFTAMKIIHAELMESIRFPDGYWYEDSIMSQMIYPLAQKRGMSAYGIEQCVYNYTINPKGISASGRTSPKSLDSLWITLQLYRDRQALGLENDQDYYEYILNMVSLSFRRCENQSVDVKKAMFVVWKNFIEQEFSGYRTENSKKAVLEQAVRGADFKLYCAACQLI